MNKLLCSIMASLALSASVQAVETMAGSMNDAHTGTSAQHSYQAGMDKMHQQMSESMQETDPDKAFAKGMTAHHQGAIDMAKAELQYGKDPEMRALAEEIIKAQQPEIDRMQNWLKKQQK